MLDELPPDIPGGIVVGMELFPALLALELVPSTVVLVREPTFGVTAPLARIGRRNRVHVNPVFLRFVFDVALEFFECPLLELTGIRDRSRMFSGSRTQSPYNYSLQPLVR